MDLIATLNTHRQDIILTQRLLSGVMLGNGYVVTTSGGVALDYDVADKVATNPRPCRFGSAPRFTKEDAQALAANLTDGHGKPGQAIHINDLLRDKLAEVETMLATLTNA